MQLLLQTVLPLRPRATRRGRQFAVVAAFVACPLLCLAATPTNGWQPRFSDADAGIQVYLPTTAVGFTEFKGVTRVKSRLSAFIALMRDVDRMPQWVYRTKKAAVLERLSNTEVYAYTVNAMDWPLQDRDAVVHSTLSQEAGTLVVTIKGSAEPDFWPRDEKYVRMRVVESYWRFTPLESGLVEVEFQGYGDPGGNLSSGLLKWIAQRAIWEAPDRTLLGMREVMTDVVYQSSSFDFIAEPGR